MSRFHAGASANPTIGMVTAPTSNPSTPDIPAPTIHSSRPAAAGSTCVVVLGEGSSTRELDLLNRALSACGAALARAARVTVNAGQLHEVPAASAYLVFGEAQAHALGRGLPVAVLQRAQIVLVDDLTQVLTDAGAKRRLWGALRRLRQTLAAASG